MSINNKDKSLETMKKKLDDYEFDFQEAMWEDMEQKLDMQVTASTKWKKIYYILPIIALLIVDFYFLTGNKLQQNNPSESIIVPTHKLSEVKTITENNNDLIEVIDNTPTNNASKGAMEGFTKPGEYKNEASKIAHQQNRQPRVINGQINVSKQDLTKNNTLPSAEILTDGTNTITQKGQNDTTTSQGKEESTESVNNLSNVQAISSRNSANFLLANEAHFNLPVFPKIQKQMPSNQKTFGIIGGVNSIIVNDPSPRVKFGGFLGLRYRKSIHPKFNIGVNFTFNRIPLSEAISMYYADTIATPRGFAATTDTRYIRNIMYLEGAINLSYKLPALKSVIKIGLRPTYHLGHDVDIHTTYSSYGGGRISDEVKKDYIDLLERNNYGLRKLNLGVSVGYEYQISPSWSLSLDYRQGITDISKDYFYRNKQKNRNSHLRLGLSYWIF